MTHAFDPGIQASKRKIWMRTFFPNVAKLARLTAFISTTKRSTKKLNHNLPTNLFSSIWITKNPFWVYKHFKKKGNAFVGEQIQVPDAGPGAYWLS